MQKTNEREMYAAAQKQVDSSVSLYTSHRCHPAQCQCNWGGGGQADDPQADPGACIVLCRFCGQGQLTCAIMSEGRWNTCMEMSAAIMAVTELL